MAEQAGMNHLIADIRTLIEEKLNTGCTKFIIFPFGDIGMHVKRILNSAYGIQEEAILDNHLCQYNTTIQPTEFLAGIDCQKYTLLLSSTNLTIYADLKKSMLNYFKPNQIAELPTMRKLRIGTNPPTTVGKYSYGPICHNHLLIESIGSFCSFAIGVDVVQNHEIRFITTHPMISYGHDIENIKRDYNDVKGKPFYFDGVQPHEEVIENKRSKIGNDVWLGRNVLITNGSNIGNGVIAGAGAIITKDVPDYAIVVGVPARIIRYRYSPKQIAGLNQIQWWNWTDAQIRERYNDLYLPIDEFLKKYL